MNPIIPNLNWCDAESTFLFQFILEIRTIDKIVTRQLNKIIF